MPKTTTDRRIEELEAQEASLYEAANAAYWQGKNAVCRGLESQIERIQYQLIVLEEKRCMAS